MPTVAVAECREQRPLYDVPLSAEIQRYIFNVSDYYGVGSGARACGHRA